MLSKVQVSSISHHLIVIDIHHINLSMVCQTQTKSDTQEKRSKHFIYNRNAHNVFGRRKRS